VLVEELDFAAAVASDVAAADAPRHPCRGEIRDTIAVTGDLLITCGDVLENVQTGPAGRQQDAQVDQGLAALASARSKAGDATLARLGDDDRLGQDGQTLVTARDLSLSVLRSTALGTGASALRAVVGTSAAVLTSVPARARWI
jgi:hypothetical protein